MSLKIVIISDSHNLHRKLKLPEADMIIHCGDFSSRGRPLEVFDFLDWYAKLPYKHKVLVCGNHEVGLDRRISKNHSLRDAFEEECELNNIYLLNESCITIQGYNIFGSPWTPEFCKWAFMYDRKFGKYKWEGIPQPNTVDIIVNHGQPYSILDPDLYGRSVGCKDYYNKIKAMSNLKLVCGGHLHSGFGQKTEDGVLFVNASCCTDEYKLRKTPFHLIELPDKE